ncbi:hypothetical protein ABK040_004331 [Willaertia magna]
MNIVFLMDTSSSMNQLTSNGMKLIDISKSCVEHFIKVRQRHLHHQQKKDNYFLITTNQKVVVGWNDCNDSTIFLQRLKNLKANDLTEIGPSLKRCFDLLNQYRLQKGVDHYGVGRFPNASENSAIILLTDGERLTHSYNPFYPLEQQQQKLPIGLDGKICFDVNKLTLPNPHTYATKLTEEPFRWDQRVFSVILQFHNNPSNPSSLSNPNQLNNSAAAVSSSTTLPIINDNAITPISEVTGGQSRTFNNMANLLKYMEELAGVILSRPTVVVNFEIVKTLSTKQHTLFPLANNEGLGKTLLYMLLVNTPASNPQGGAAVNQQKETFWPIPENYYPHQNMNELPTRKAQPTISLLYTEKNDILQTLSLNKFPYVDTFEISTSSPIGKFILQHSTSREGCYKAFVVNSTTSNYGFGESFGFIKKLMITTNTTTNELEPKIYFYLLPYNYMRLFYLMNEYVSTHKMQPNSAWIQQYHKFVQNLPPYYIRPLKQAMSRWFGNFNYFPEVPYDLPFTLRNYLAQQIEEEKRANQKEEELILAENMESDWLLKEKKNTSSFIRNPLEMDRNTLLRNYKLMSAQLFHGKSASLESELLSLDQARTIDEKLHLLSKEEIRKHSVPISQMGNFDKVLMNKEVLRDPFETQGRKVNTFGSPYPKNGKKKRPRNLNIRSPTGGSPSNLLEKVVDIDEKNSAFVGDEIDQMAIEIEKVNNESPTLSNEEGTGVNTSNNILNTPSNNNGLPFSPPVNVISDENMEQIPLIQPLESKISLDEENNNNGMIESIMEDKKQTVTQQPPSSPIGKASNFRPPMRKQKSNPIKEQTNILNEAFGGNVDILKRVSLLPDNLLIPICTRAILMDGTEGKRKQALDTVRNKIRKRKRNNNTEDTSVDDSREIITDISKINFPSKEAKTHFLKEIIILSTQFKKNKLAALLVDEYTQSLQ